MPLKALYLSKVNSQIARYSEYEPPLVTEADLIGLPEPVQRYFRHCGFVDRDLVYNAWVEWENCFLKISETSPFTPLKIGSFNSVPEPFRTAYLYNRIFGFIPLEGYGTYADGREEAAIKLMRIFSPRIPTGKVRDESALVSLLQEALFVPGYALQSYIQWMPINALSARAMIRDKYLEVSGTFRFSEAGECLQFETEDRHYVMRDNTSIQVSSTIAFENYRTLNGVLSPTSMRAIWHLASGDFEYYKGDLKAIHYNRREPVAGF